MTAVTLPAGMTRRPGMAGIAVAEAGMVEVNLGPGDGGVAAAALTIPVPGRSSMAGITVRAGIMDIDDLVPILSIMA